MKQVSAALKTLIESGQFVQGAGPAGFFVPFDLYTITTQVGLVMLYTTANFKIAAPDNTIFDAPNIIGAGNVWFSGIAWNPIPIDLEGSRSTGSWKGGLDADTWTVQAAPRASDLIGSRPWLEAVTAGELNGADCIVSRAYFSAMPSYDPGSPAHIPATGAVPVGTLIMFRGQLSEVDVTDTSASLIINDYRLLLRQMMPRNIYLPACRNRFGDARCTINLATYSNTGIASGASARALIIATGAVTTPGGSATYTLGTITMTSGKNSGFKRFVAGWSAGTTFALLNPFPYDIAAGDTFSVLAGCDKTMANCTAFANLVNFRGESFVPVPETSII